MYILSGGNEDPLGMEATEMADDTDQANPSDPQLLLRQFTTVFEYSELTPYRPEARDQAALRPLAILTLTLCST
jgi:hypothetical protein